MPDIELQDPNNVKLGQGQPRLIILTIFCMAHIPRPTT